VINKLTSVSLSEDEMGQRASKYSIIVTMILANNPWLGEVKEVIAILWFMPWYEDVLKSQAR
jgi:hypothetical protein